MDRYKRDSIKIIGLIINETKNDRDRKAGYYCIFNIF